MISTGGITIIFNHHLPTRGHQMVAPYYDLILTDARHHGFCLRRNQETQHGPLAIPTLNIIKITIQRNNNITKSQ